jgi:hypothetical protein
VTIQRQHCESNSETTGCVAPHGGDRRPMVGGQYSHSYLSVFVGGKRMNRRQEESIPFSDLGGLDQI